MFARGLKTLSIASVVLIIGAFAPDAQGHYPPAAYAAAFLFTCVGTALALTWYATLARRSEAAARPASSANSG